MKGKCRVCGKVATYPDELVGIMFCFPCMATRHQRVKLTKVKENEKT